MDKPGGQDRSREDEREGSVGQQQGGRKEERGNIGQQQGSTTGTSGRDADLQKEGNLGNERNRGGRGDEDEQSDMGTRPGQNR